MPQRGFSVLLLIVLVALLITLPFAFKLFNKDSQNNPENFSIQDKVATNQVRIIEEGAVKGWEFSIGDSAYKPIYEEGVVYFGSDDGNFYALNASDGNLKWRFQPKGRDDTYVGQWNSSKQKTQHTEQRVRSTPIIIDNSVFIRSFDNYVYALNKETGQEVWNYQTSEKFAFDSSLFSDGTNLYAFAGNTLIAINSEGKRLWETSFDSDVIPVINRDYPKEVYIADDNLDFYRIDNATGERKFQFSLKNIFPGTYEKIYGPVIKSKNVYYFYNSENYLYAYNYLIKKVLWKYQAGPDNTGSVVMKNNKLFISSSENPGVYALDINTGKTLWEFRNEDLRLTHLTADEKAVYAQGEKLYSLDINTGKELWSYKLPGGFTSSDPTADNGYLFIGTVKGFYGIRLQ